jgi:hypothetical protein
MTKGLSIGIALVGAARHCHDAGACGRSDLVGNIHRLRSTRSAPVSHASAVRQACKARAGRRILRVHYQWCVGVPYANAGAERDARRRYLRACR